MQDEGLGEQLRYRVGFMDSRLRGNDANYLILLTFPIRSNNRKGQKTELQQLTRT